MIFKVKAIKNKILLLLLIHLLQLSFITCSSSQSLNQSNYKTHEIAIAIMKVEYNSTVEKKYVKITRDFIEEEFSTYREYKVIDRLDIDKILNELALDDTGLVEANVKRIGKLIKADRLLFSKLQKVGNIWILTGRLIDVKTGEVINTATGRVSKPVKLDGAAKGLSRRITDRL